MSNEIKHGRRHFLGAAAMSLAVDRLGIFGLGGLSRMTLLHPQAEGVLASLNGATAWLNSPPLTAKALRGRVVLVAFWTYTCINWMRTMPWLRAWSERYTSQGLTVIGVHTPEFSFEHDLDNVRQMAAELRVAYPIAVDNKQGIWRGFDNNYWPALYFVDAEGRLQGHAYGEGDYDGSERTIQRLLTASGAKGIDRELVKIEAAGVELPADWGTLKSPENYVGYGRSEHFASPGGAVPDQAHAYELPSVLKLNHWGVAGMWQMGREALALRAPNGRIGYRFQARDLHLVMGAPIGAAPVRFRIRIDGQAPGEAHGGDVDPEGNGIATRQRLYQLIRQTGTIRERQFEIEFLDSGVEAFAFTFG